MGLANGELTVTEPQPAAIPACTIVLGVLGLGNSSKTTL